MGTTLFVLALSGAAGVSAGIAVVLGFAMGWCWRGAVDAGRLHVQSRAFAALMRRLGIHFKRD